MEYTDKQLEILLDMCRNLPKGKEGWLFSMEGKAVQYHIYLTPSMEETDILDLDMKPRANHCLQRAGIHTIGQFIETIHCTADLKQFRSLGVKTATEIMLSLLFYQYTLLPPERRRAYMHDLYQLNTGKDKAHG